MTRKEYRDICEMTKKGEQRTILNLDNHSQGEVLSCHHDYFNVRVGKGWEVWDRQACEMSIKDHDPGNETRNPLDFQI